MKVGKALMAFTIWQAMYGNGWRIGTPIPIIKIRLSRILWAPTQVNIEWYVAPLGVTLALGATSVLRIEVTSFPIIFTAALVFAVFVTQIHNRLQAIVHRLSVRYNPLASPISNL